MEDSSTGKVRAPPSLPHQWATGKGLGSLAVQSPDAETDFWDVTFLMEKEMELVQEVLRYQLYSQAHLETDSGTKPLEVGWNGRGDYAVPPNMHIQ